MVDGVKRVYYDSNVWVSYMRGSKDRFFGICSPLFDRVERGLVFVVVSHLAMAETIHALRKLATNEFKPTFGVTGDHAEKQSECESVGKRLIEYVNALVDNKNAEIANYSDALNTIPASFQRSPTILDASREASSPNTGTPVWARIEHAYLALGARASEFYSTDKAFDALNGDPEFAGASFKVLS